MKKAILTAVIFTASTGMVASASEAAQFGYNFDSQNGNATQTDPLATLSTVTLTGDLGSNFSGAGNPGSAASIVSEGFTATLEFTVTPTTQLSLTNFSYDVAANPSSVGVFSSLDALLPLSIVIPQPIYIPLEALP
jgi:hypothetical protein